MLTSRMFSVLVNSGITPEERFVRRGTACIEGLSV